MASLRILSAADQVAAHLRKKLSQGSWSGMLPGSDRMAAELGVGNCSMETALLQLEKEGLLVPHGSDGRRSIVASTGLKKASPMLNVAILFYEARDCKLEYIVDLKHSLTEAGHVSHDAPNTLTEARMDLQKIARMVGKNAADAWVVLNASSEVLEWFCEQKIPAFALFGKYEGLPMAGTKPDKTKAFAEATRELVALGHRRLVILARRQQRLPQAGRCERACLEELEKHGIQTGPFNLPDWEETTEGLHAMLDSLFRVNPPTAMIIEEPPFFAAAQQFLASKGIKVPDDVSMVCTDPDPNFAWCQPQVSHIQWDARPVVGRIVSWTENVSQGRTDVSQTNLKAEYVRGGTIGPVSSRQANSTKTRLAGKTSL